MQGLTICHGQLLDFTITQLRRLPTPAIAGGKLGIYPFCKGGTRYGMRRMTGRRTLAASPFAALVPTFAADGEATGVAIETDIQPIVAAFHKEMAPLESADELKILTDNRTGARYCECHILADKLVGLATTDAPLDPENQPEHKANREILGNAFAFTQMKEDALQRRSFSNLVAEYTKEFAPDTPLKIIGGQHRHVAIREAHGKGVNELHGLKVYFGLTTVQRIDVAVVSNRNLAISGALLDRLKETYRGPAMRDWCHAAGLLPHGQDFADRQTRGGRLAVHLARTFIHNFYLGQTVTASAFKETETTPTLYAAGRGDDIWEIFLSEHPDIWEDAALLQAGKEFAKMVNTQRGAFKGQQKVPGDFPQKAMNPAVLSAWAYTAGMLQANPVRLTRHYALSVTKGTRDPLNARDLAKGRHRSDGDSYRGLGHRTDARERGQMVELFNLLAEDDDRITASKINAAIYAWFAKKAAIDANKARESSLG
jgi:hypothetical protein